MGRIFRIASGAVAAAVALTLPTATAHAESATGNDEIAGATTIRSLPFSATQNITGLTASPDDPARCWTGVTSWYTFKARRAGTIEVGVWGTYIPNNAAHMSSAVAVYTGRPARLRELACDEYDDNRSSVSPNVQFDVRRKQRIYVMVGDTALTADANLSMSAKYVAFRGQTANDTSPPVLNAPLTADFVVGSTIGPMTRNDRGELQNTFDIAMRARWTATDQPSGICGYSAREEYAAFNKDWSDWSDVKSATKSTTDYDDQFGGGTQKFHGLSVRARDCAGNITERFIDFRPILSQEDGETFGYGDIGTPEYAGNWRSASCACWSGGSVRKTTQAGASVSFEGGDHHTALVMTKGPNRGAAKVYVGGSLRAIVDTHSATNVNRAVVWNGTTNGATVKVVNVGTVGHPRIDLDGVLID